MLNFYIISCGLIEQNREKWIQKHKNVSLMYHFFVYHKELISDKKQMNKYKKCTVLRPLECWLCLPFMQCFKNNVENSWYIFNNLIFY